MTKKTIFLSLAILGFVAPYFFFLQVPPESALDLSALIQPLFANNFMKGVGMDPVSYTHLTLPTIYSV